MPDFNAPGGDSSPPFFDVKYSTECFLNNHFEAACLCGTDVMRQMCICIHSFDYIYCPQGQAHLQVFKIHKES